jgi:hypothetical protein
MIVQSVAWPARLICALTPSLVPANSFAPDSDNASLLFLLIPILAALAVIAGLYLFVFGFQLLRRKRWIEDTPVTKIAAAAIGYVKIQGHAAGPYTMLSPLAAVDCYFYRTIAWNGRDANNQQAEGRAVESLYAPLFVEDDTGRMLLDPRGAQLALPPDYEEQISDVSMSEGARRFLHRHGLSITNPTTVSEYAIKPGDPLLVVGAVKENRSQPDARPCVDYLDREAADLQRREQLEAMGIPYSEMPPRSAPTSSDFDLHPAVILGAAGQPFLFSRGTPQDLVDNLSRQSALAIWGGPLLALFGLGTLLRWLGVW